MKRTAFLLSIGCALVIAGCDRPAHDGGGGGDRVAQLEKQVTAMKDRDRLLQLCVEINRHENVADTHYRVALAALFKRGNDPLLVMKWRDIYDQLENATDRCEDVANIIEGVVLEHA